MKPHVQDVILNAIGRLRWAGKHAVEQNAEQDGETFKEFNELLLLGYFEEGKISVSCQAILLFSPCPH